MSTPLSENTVRGVTTPGTNAGSYAPRTNAAPGPAAHLSDDDTRAVPLTRAVDASGRATIHEYDFDRFRGFDRIHILKLDPPHGVGGEGGFAVCSQREENLQFGLAETMAHRHDETRPFGHGFGPEERGVEADAVMEASSLLDACGEDIKAWARDTYQVDVDRLYGGGERDENAPLRWHELTMTVHAADLPRSATSDQVIEHADTPTMQTLVSDLETGDFYTRLLDEAPGYLASREGR